MLGVKPLLKSIRGWMAGNLFSAFLSKVLVSLGGIEQAELEHGTILTNPCVLETLAALALQSHYRLYNLNDILEKRSQVSYRGLISLPVHYSIIGITI